MSRYRFELATPADDADLRQVLAEPMPGSVQLSFRREPSYFAAAVVDGRWRQVVAARDLTTGHIVGFGSRSIGERYVNGQPQPVGYLSSLRLLRAHRSRLLVARGYSFFRDLHEDEKTLLYLTTIAADNTPAVRLLTSGRAGLPAYHYAGRFHTIAIPFGVSGRGNSEDLMIRPASPQDWPGAVKFWNTIGPERQFFPCLRDEDFFSPTGAYRDLQREDLLLAFRRGKLVGTLAAWDQSSFRQAVVHGYSRVMHWLRPIYNIWAWLRGRPRLPRAGAALHYVMGALFAVADNDMAVAKGLIDAHLQRRPDPKCSYLLLGLHENDPLDALRREYPTRTFDTHLYLVCWPDGEGVRQSLDGRPPFLELGSL